MGNSGLVEYIKISPNKSVPRNHAVDTVTIHCMAGQLSVEACGNVFAASKAQASSNYGVGKDGRVAMYVEEKDRSWCSSNAANDNRAVTIEVASDSFHPYAVSDAAYKALVILVADICKRNGIKKLVWSRDRLARINHTGGANMTVHRDFANKACPGDYLYGRMEDIADRVNAMLEGKPVGKNGGTMGKDGPGKDGRKAPRGVPYAIRVISDILEVRKNPGREQPYATSVKKGEVYTIVEERKAGHSRWGRLKSGVGWVSLSGTEKI